MFYVPGNQPFFLSTTLTHGEETILYIQKDSDVITDVITKVMEVVSSGVVSYTVFIFAIAILLLTLHDKDRKS